MPPIRILLIEDTPADVAVMQEAFADERADFDVTHAGRLDAGLKHLAQKRFDLVLLDLNLPDSQGVDTVSRVRAQAPRTPIVVLTASDDDVLAMQAVQRGAQDYLVKGYVQVYHNLLGRAVRYAIERQRAEDEVRNAHARTAQLLSSIPSILIQINTEAKVTHWNAVAEATFGIRLADVIDRPFASCGIRWDTAKIVKAFTECLQTNAALSLDDMPFKYADGQDGFLGITLVPMRGEESDARSGVLLFGADVTKRKQAELERGKLQDQLMQAQKMETIGRFAGGIAHDFNNFLQVILGFAWLIRARHQNDRELMSDLQEIVHSAESASGMVHQLLAFSRRQPLQPKVFEINNAIRNMARLLQQFVGEPIRVDLDLLADPMTVKLDPTGLEQCLMNLCANARDSMPQGGTLTIKTALQANDAAFMDSHPTAQAPDYVKLTIQDTGSGMDPMVAAHIFEPFFTTKQVGKGTGLGLAVVYGLVKQHEGFIEIDTAPGQGTAFHLYVPRQAEAAPAVAEAPSGGSKAAAGTEESIFLVSGDARQRNLNEKIVSEAGYLVAGSCDEHQAMERLEKYGYGVDVVLLDAAIPGMTPRDVLGRVRKLRPDTKILLVSEDPDAALRGLVASMSGVRILEKPYAPARLLDHVRELLDEVQPSRPARPAQDGARRHRILVVDDDPSIRRLCERILNHHDVKTVPSGRAALDVLGREGKDLLLTDLRMPNMDGIALIGEVMKLAPMPRIMVMTGSLTSEMEQRLRTLQVPMTEDVLRKPFSAPALVDAVNRCLAQRA
jgi:PAS domain S-box-containing protein